ncbi:MAG: hypothetical protein MUC57_09660 [Desulfobacterales bacterium]|jgi:hypothetical protein|nr:hypothetical protein [Desulfobacterales bacterium]
MKTVLGNEKQPLGVIHDMRGQVYSDNPTNEGSGQKVDTPIKLAPRKILGAPWQRRN